MEKKEIHIQIDQEVRYAEMEASDQWHHDTVGEFLSLTTYKKVIYQDAMKRMIHVKWYPVEEKSGILVEIQQGQQTFRFHPQRPTDVTYQSQIGDIPLELHTQQIQVTQEQESGRVKLEYQLYNQDQLLGEYKFLLNYRD